MEYKKTKRTNHYIFEGSKHASKRQKFNVNSQCKGIMISSVNRRRLNTSVKEFLTFLEINFPPTINNDSIKESNEHVMEIEDQENKSSEIEKQMMEEISKVKSEEKRFMPLRNIIKNYAFIKFGDNEYRNPSEIVNNIFWFLQKKREKHILKNVCKVLPYDYICKPHVGPFIKTVLPLLKLHFSNSKCVLEDFTSGYLLKLLNVPPEKIEGEEKKNDETNGDNINEVGQENKFIEQNGKIEADAEEKGDKDEEQIVREKEKKEYEKEDQDKKDEEVEVAKEETAKEETAKEETAKEEVAKEEVAKEEVAKEEVAKEEVAKEEVAKEEVAKEEVVKEEVVKKENNDPMKKTSWALVYKCMNNNTLLKKDVLTVLDKCIGKNYSVNLSNPDLAIVVNVSEIMCGISIVKDYGITRKFNVSAFNATS
ncbi:conserved Plasmodium protein, unknown function [Plasmodium ovale]|uniref:THUMP domain-containing protein n=2 Tax=Plasmodium ovale TaxID=36330 RepID=A0A1A8X3B4_PLAOA|nr:conserved Plasmodium protein, unknown function [Plasmodium ovale curtisi]SBS98667.1 conserved Plasmodium protein, unknown function [Plasmodium ovale curtisi]SCQ17291.1 conserved Plasmodium protein, unknown function [Plasmodium ovale]